MFLYFIYWLLDEMWSCFKVGFLYEINGDFRIWLDYSLLFVFVWKDCCLKLVDVKVFVIYVWFFGFVVIIFSMVVYNCFLCVSYFLIKYVDMWDKYVGM